MLPLDDQFFMIDPTAVEQVTFTLFSLYFENRCEFSMPLSYKQKLTHDLHQHSSPDLVPYLRM